MSSQEEGFSWKEGVLKELTVYIDYEKCIVCGSCIDNCPFGAMELVEGVTTWAHPELCEHCGICSMICEDDAITMTEPEGTEV